VFSFYKVLNNILLPFYANFLFLSPYFLAHFFTLLLIIFGITKIIRTKNKFLWVLPLWIVLNLIGLSLYKGHIPDYYFVSTLVPFILIIAMSISKNLILFIPVTAFFLYQNLNHLLNFSSSLSYKTKKEAVNFVLKDTNNETFNVYYDFPPGLNTGYSYIFKVHGREPMEGGKNLYIFTLVDPQKFNPEKYRSSNLIDKKIKSRNFGFVEVTSIK
jgi:hypothetical protein